MLSLSKPVTALPQPRRLFFDMCRRRRQFPPLIGILGTTMPRIQYQPNHPSILPRDDPFHTRLYSANAPILRMCGCVGLGCYCLIPALDFHPSSPWSQSARDEIKSRKVMFVLTIPTIYSPNMLQDMPFTCTWWCPFSYTNFIIPKILNSGTTTRNFRTMNSE